MYSFVNICKVNSPNKTTLKSETEPENLSDTNDAHSSSNIIGGKFTGYFTPNLVIEIKYRGMCEEENTKFSIERSVTSRYILISDINLW